MPKKTYTTEQIISKVREGELLLRHGQTVLTIRKTLGIAEQTYYWWCKAYGGLKIDQTHLLRGLDVSQRLIDYGQHPPTTASL